MHNLILAISAPDQKERHLTSAVFFRPVAEVGLFELVKVSAIEHISWLQAPRLSQTPARARLVLITTPEFSHTY